MRERISASSLLPGKSASTSSVGIPSLRPFISGAPAKVSWQVGLSCAIGLLVCAEDGTTVALLLANDGEPADLDAVQATDTVIRKDMMARNIFITHMMPRSAGQCHRCERVGDRAPE